jgi:exosome complex component RRP41
MRSQTMYDRANLNVELTMAAFSTGERRRRTRGDKSVYDLSALRPQLLIPCPRRILEMAATIKSTFEPVVQTNLYPRSQIDIFVHVLQQDGGLLQACINATTLALINAGIPLYDYVCAVTGGVHSASPLLDLTALEENDAPNVTVAMTPRTGKVTLVTMETRLHVERFEEIFRLGRDAGKVIHKEMRAAIQATTRQLIGSLESVLPTTTAEKDDRVEL